MFLMKKIAIMIIFLFSIWVSGCASVNQLIKGSYPMKYFKSGAITYSVDPDALDQMNNMEILAKQLPSYDKNLAERNSQIIYRDTDRNRDYVITKEEAFFAINVMSKRYEQSLGSIWSD